MYLCYMDESGDPGVGPGSPTPTYTMAGIFLKDRQWLSVFDEILEFRRYLRDSFGLRMRDEIKATDLVRGSGPWANLPYGEQVRKSVYRAFMRLQGKVGVLKTFAVVVDKSKFATTVEVRDCAWRYALQRVERFGHYNDDVVMILADVGDHAHRRKLARKMRRFAPVSGFYGGGPLQRPLVNVVDDPVERLSHESYFVQLADLNAYAAYRRMVPTPRFPQLMWDELDSALLLEVNKVRSGPPAIVEAP